ncbi:hypothetical protein [Terriglobus saanensis]|uniref:Uncharacterized protein n=1 Tax=Terriglobus saanensis (strain ATCC BAA-1853 / DSM 23119 / SP1PR4) TaxID=401053 RepID=E8UYD3_TERSS|nr:hypothetical protein [Terriglobus saanensis]ADV82021.1 hypothetical protein AciPR4_1195 [Terriglobus saanensis SP1PR4]
MAIDNNITTADSTELGANRKRYWMYWASAVASSLLFLFFVASMLIVPGVTSSRKIWMLTVMGVGAAASLGIGLWRFRSTEAPATLWPLGPIIGVVLLLEFAYCAVRQSL